LVADSPDKGIGDRAKDAERITTPLAEAMRSAEDRLIILSAYFVPLSGRVEFLTDLADRGVDVTVVTNSLAANNQFTVHGDYAPARKPPLGQAQHRAWRDDRGPGAGRHLRRLR
jgi:putative cardiolipin synthase